MKTTITIGGMSCAHCAGRVEKALNAIPGIMAKVNLERGIAEVESDKEPNVDILTNAIINAGYTVIK